MANTRTIKIVINLRSLENSDSCDSGSSCCDDASAQKRDPKVALEAARQLGRSCGGGGGCADSKPACPVEESPCPAPPPPPPKTECPKKECPKKECPKKECPKKECPEPAKETPCPAKEAACPAKEAAAPAKDPPPAPKSKCQEKKLAAAAAASCEAKEPPPPKKTCPPKPEPSCPPKPEPTCPPKPEPACPPKPEPACPPKPEPACPPKTELNIAEPKKCTPPRYINTDVRPDGKEQQCKEGTSTDGKCRQLGQQKQRRDEEPNPASSGGMVQFFKNQFYNATTKS